MPGCIIPRKRLTVNLAPASVRKEGPAYDLPIALGVLIASRAAPPGERWRARWWWASFRWMAACATCAACCRWQPSPASRASSASSSPRADAAEAALIPDLEVIPVGSLAALYAHLCGREPHPAPGRRSHPKDLPAVRADRFRRDQRPGARQARPGSGRGRRA